MTKEIKHYTKGFSIIIPKSKLKTFNQSISLVNVCFNAKPESVCCGGSVSPK